MGAKRVSSMFPQLIGRLKCESIPSRSSQKLILVWPRPMVYLPALTPSYFSSSAWSTHCGEILAAVPGPEK